MRIVGWKLSQLSEYLLKFVLAQREHSLKLNKKLTHFIKSMFQKHKILGPHIWQYIPGPVELSYTRYRSKMYDRIFNKIYF